MAYDCIVIGAGPGGYVAAIRAAQLGLKTAVIEKENPGGVCLNWGCIPTKALLKSAEVFNTFKHAKSFGLRAEGIGYNFSDVIDRSRGVVDQMTKGVSFLLKKNKIDLIMGEASLKSKTEIEVKDSSGKSSIHQFGKAIIATGARARTLPSLPVDEKKVITYRKALEMKDKPERMLVVGAGAIGVEFAYFFNSFETDVTIVELMDGLLPIEDEDISKALGKSLTKAGINVKTGSLVEKLDTSGSGVKATIKTGDKVEEWEGDKVLVAIGVQGNIESLGLEKVGIEPEKSFIEVDEFYRTGIDNIYAIGDITGPPLLAHVASHEGIIAAEHAAGHSPHPLDYSSIPGCTYCQPQVASVGMTEKAAKEAGRNVRTGNFPFTASGKAVAIAETEGMVKVIVDTDIEEILGVHIIHAEATELIAEATLAKTHEATASSVLETIHAHPTLSEAVMEAMGAALGRPIHI